MPDLRKHIWNHTHRDRFPEDRKEPEARLRKRGKPWIALTAILQEFAFAFRRLRRVPGFTAVVLLSLGLGIGANAAIFSIVKGILLDPLPFDEPEQLVGIWNSAPGIGDDLIGQSLAVNAVYEDEARSFEHVGLWAPGKTSIMGREGPEEASTLFVTQGLFQALRVRPILGRLFTFEDTQPGFLPTVILSYSYWQSRFDSDPGVIGRTMDINGSPREIIGVMPDGFRVMDQDADIFQPERYNKATIALSNFSYKSIARLAKGVTIQQALTEMGTLLFSATERYPGPVTRKFLEEVGGKPVLHPLRDDLVGNVRGVLWVVLAGAAVILLISCANVANLLLVKAEGRERALAVQSAIGSSMSRMLWQFIAEGLTLGISGGILGVGLAVAGLRLFQAAGPGNLPRLHEIDLDAGVLFFTVAISTASGIAFGLLAWTRSWRIDLAQALKESGWAPITGRPRNRIRNTLVVAQLALAFVLLAGSGLMIRSFISLTRIQPGFSKPEEILTFRISVSSAQEPDPQKVAQIHEALARRLAELPGVVSVGLSTSVPMSDGFGWDPVFVEDFPVPQGQQPRTRRFKWIGGGYHEAIGNPVIAGRAMDWTDIRNRTQVVMITEGMARELWGDPARAVGRRIGVGTTPGNWREIIGVVKDVRDDGMEHPPVDIVYWPMVMDSFWDKFFVQRRMAYVIRSERVGTPGFLEDVRSTVWSMLPDRPLAVIRTMDDIRKDSMARTSFTLVMLAVASGVALFLGSLGIYGVISYVVGRRTHELGIRIAIGAERGMVIAMILRQGFVLAIIGVIVGLGAAFGITRFMEGIIFGVSPVDPLTFVVVSAGVTAVALLACYLPARRAAKVDPVIALRAM